MRTAAALVAAGSLLLTTPARPSPSASTSSSSSASEARGTAVAAARAASEGIDFGPCAEEQELPPSVECGTLRVPLDYTRPDGEQIRLTVSRSRATGRTPRPGARCPVRAPGEQPGRTRRQWHVLPDAGRGPGLEAAGGGVRPGGLRAARGGPFRPAVVHRPEDLPSGPRARAPHPTAAVKRSARPRGGVRAGCAERAGTPSSTTPR
ncbi:hypothetical protein ACFQV4_13705 [Streptomyces thermocarboxydus]